MITESYFRSFVSRRYKKNPDIKITFVTKSKELYLHDISEEDVPIDGVMTTVPVVWFANKRFKGLKTEDLLKMLESTDRPVYMSLLDFDFKRVSSINAEDGVIKMYTKKPIKRKEKKSAESAD